MNLNVRKFEEQDDGSAICEIVMDEETKIFLINHAFIDILSRALKDFNNKFDSREVDFGEWNEARIDIVGANGNVGYE